MIALHGVIASVACSASEKPPTGPPNVLMIVVDTLRADRLSSYGDERGLTPFLDGLAVRGVVFANAYAPSSWTVPSIASLFTSRYASQHRTTAYESVLAPSERTLAERLAAVGFETVGISANPRLERRFGYGQGFRRWFVAPEPSPADPITEHKTRAGSIAARALAFLDGRSPPLAPVFLYLHFMEPHAPFLAPDPYRARHAAGSLEEHLAVNRRLIDPNDPFGVSLSAADLSLLSNLYDGEVASLDAQLRSLFAQLHERGFLDDTIVVITSDHGEEFGEHRLQGHGFTLYDTSLRVPLIFLLPGDAGGRVVETYGSLVDLAPTLLDLLGLPAERRFEGQSLAAQLRGAQNTSSNILAELIDDAKISYREHTVAVIRPPLKLLKRRSGETEVYDLQSDPGETERRLESPEVASELQQWLDSRTAELATRANREKLVAPLDDTTRDGLRALGYAVE